MARILAVDYGLKRTGLAVTDPLQIIATALETVPTHQLMNFLDTYFSKEVVDKIVVGEPKKLNNLNSDIHSHVEGFVRRISEKYPKIQLFRIDERFSTVIAQRTMLMSGTSKKDRRQKENLDKISATILLQDFLEFQLNFKNNQIP